MRDGHGWDPWHLGALLNHTMKIVGGFEKGLRVSFVMKTNNMHAGNKQMGKDT